MLLTIPGLLDAGRLAGLRALLDTARWVDGRATAGRHAAAVKANRQAAGDDPTVRAAAAEIEAAIRAHPVAAAAALPRRFGRILVSRTPPGGGYGTHVDNAFQGHGEDAIRTDLAFTLFLTGSPEVGGGALIVEDAGGERAVAPEAGLLVLYPATFLHRVETVTDGERIAAVGWIQSRVRDAGQRALLFDLHLAERGGPDAALRIQLARANLLRRWAEG